MSRLTWKLVIPITIISFSIFTKWWYVLPVDAPDTMMSGFPLIWVSEGWHTSMSLQIFVTELIINLLLYFLFWLIVVYTVNRFIIKVKLPTVVTIIMLAISGLICLGALWIGTMPEHVFMAKRDFDMEVLSTGYKFIWQRQDRPKYESLERLKNKKK